MTVTVADIMRMPEFQGMKILAGRSGLGNIVTNGGLLDYEYAPEVKEKYIHRHFEKGQFVLTSFLYAKDNEHLIFDAVKRLQQRGCSGLAIKNIYKINIRDSISRFADAHHFPIFTIVSNTLYFEDILFLIKSKIHNATSVFNDAVVADKILYSFLDEKSIEQLALDINPSFGDEIVAAFFRIGDEFTSNDYLSFISKKSISELLKYTDKLFFYKNGIMLILSQDLGSNSTAFNHLDPLIEVVSSELERKVHVGVSDRHHNLTEFKDVLEESLCASFLPYDIGKTYCSYQNAGTFKVFMPMVRNAKAIAFSEQSLRKIQAYDAENHSYLMQTAIQYILCDGDIKRAAKELMLHINTVRYRLDTISSLMNENVLNKGGYEVLSAAIKIDICRKASSYIV